LAATIESMILSELVAALRIGVVARFDYTQTHEYIADSSIISKITGTKQQMRQSEEDLERELEIDKFYEA